MALKSNLFTVAGLAQVREFRLPSGGLPYRERFPDFPSTVIIQPYSFQTEGILVTNLQFLDKLRMVAEKVVTNFPDGFDFRELLSSDLVTILTLARALTYGEKYKFSSTCPACGTVEKHELKIPDDLPVRNWNQETMDQVRSETTITLPVCRDKISLHFMTVEEEKALGESLAGTRKQMSDAALAASGLGNPKLIRTARKIATVNETRADTPEEMLEYLKKVQGADMVALLEGIKDAEPGLNFTWDMVCPVAACATEYKEEMATSMEFFRGFN